MSKSARIEALRAEIKALEEQERKEREERVASLTREWQFTLTDVTDKTRDWNRLMDDSVRVYRLTGEVLNADELKEAGAGESVYTSGSMDYFYNRASSRFICSTGGGRIYIVSGHWTMGFNEEARREADEDAKLVWVQLNEFIDKHPEGGDVTTIILAQRHFNR